MSRWVTTHGYALNVDLDPAPFTSWITACGLEDAAFTTMARELGRPLTVDEVRPAAAAALEEVFDLAFEELRVGFAQGRFPATVELTWHRSRSPSSTTGCEAEELCGLLRANGIDCMHRSSRWARASA